MDGQSVVRAKFWVDTITETRDGKTIHMQPVVDGSQENKSFWRWTPSGELTMNILNKDAASQFEAGKSYYIDFTPAE